MKVKQFLKTFRMSSNCDVFMEHVITGDLIELKKHELEELSNLDNRFNYILNSFDVIDNVLTLYVK